MRKFKGNRRKNTPPEIIEQKPSSDETVIKNSISYSDLMGRDQTCSDNTLD
jgi:hypothetical protein